LLKRTQGSFKTFTHKPIFIKELGSVTDEKTGKRFYTTPTGRRFPSVTTILSDYKKDVIDAWRDKIGHEKADGITFQATTRGTSVHKLLEEYINNNYDYLDTLHTFDYVVFKTLKPILDKYINNILVQEASLYSDTFEVAGRTDVIGDFNGKLSVIDFKTSKKPKKKEWIDNYFMQGAIYAVMFEEITNIPITQTVIIISVDHQEPQIFVERRDNYIRNFISVRSAYKEKYGI
jgi:ATP-dependent exoDNAse (exonuclease V) beta subunit